MPFSLFLLLGCLPAVVKNSGISYVVSVPPHTINIGDRDMKRGDKLRKVCKICFQCRQLYLTIKRKIYYSLMYCI